MWYCRVNEPSGRVLKIQNIVGKIVLMRKIEFFSKAIAFHFNTLDRDID